MLGAGRRPGAHLRPNGLTETWTRSGMKGAPHPARHPDASPRSSLCQPTAGTADAMALGRRPGLGPAPLGPGALAPAQHDASAYSFPSFYQPFTFSK